MTHQELIDYISKLRATGSTDEQIMNNCRQAGWQETDIQQAFAAPSTQFDSNQSTQAPAVAETRADVQQKKMVASLKLIYLGLAVVLLFVGSAFAFYIFNQNTESTPQPLSTKSDTSSVKKEDASSKSLPNNIHYLTTKEVLVRSGNEQTYGLNVYGEDTEYLEIKITCDPTLVNIVPASITCNSTTFIERPDERYEIIHQYSSTEDTTVLFSVTALNKDKEVISDVKTSTTQIEGAQTKSASEIQTPVETPSESSVTTNNPQVSEVTPQGTSNSDCGIVSGQNLLNVDTLTTSQISALTCYAEALSTCSDATLKVNDGTHSVHSLTDGRCAVSATMNDDSKTCYFTKEDLASLYSSAKSQDQVHLVPIGISFVLVSEEFEHPETGATIQIQCVDN